MARAESSAISGELWDSPSYCAVDCPGKFGGSEDLKAAYLSRASRSTELSSSFACGRTSHISLVVRTLASRYGLIEEVDSNEPIAAVMVCDAVDAGNARSTTTRR